MPADAEAPILLPHAMPDASGSGEVSACRGPFSCSLSKTWACFFSTPGEHECMHMVHPCLRSHAPTGSALLRHALAGLSLNTKIYYAVVELSEVPNITEFSKLVHMKNARDMAFHMLFF